ncbi:uncharacterized protein OCT59_002661 [Rhizophagus irregularis]|uniref:uncharacterized protein n=1 Tax=Rhizophagus irregularis TaxID=588596 RepID=UPI003328A721|nr:hypothetical protein OCT59_002661 [Rhizophagus irregularis]
MGRRSHVKPILDIATILAERGYNVILLASGNNGVTKKEENFRKNNKNKTREKRKERKDRKEDRKIKLIKFF